MQEKPWDIIVIGAGPAGLMTAIACAEGKLRTLVLEGKETLGAKLLISGGGRCNVTNLKVSEKNYQTGEPRTVRNILRAFPSERTLEFFKAWGVEMVLEEGTQFFPKEQSAKVVLQALLQAAGRFGVVIEKGKKVQKISKEKEFFSVSGEGFEFLTKSLVIATGGLSYPGTGSDGSGYALARSLGHTILPTTPALTPLLTDDQDWKSLAGITLPVELAIFVDHKKVAQSEGAMLFTHVGFSGPAVLDISGPWLRTDFPQKELRANFLPLRREADLWSDLAGTGQAHLARSWKRALSKFLPERLTEVLLRKSGIDPSARLDQVSKKDREALLRSLFRFPLRVSGAQGYDKAEVTAGGVDLKEVDGKSLESKRCPGLFFAGEILDVDGRIGGFNFQWAWASGTVVGRSIVQKFRVH
jgi:predicted Rossmann fold flavoprotein